MQSFLPHLAPLNIAGVVILAMVAQILGLAMPVGAALALVAGFVFLVQINVLHAFSYWRVSNRALHVRAFRTVVTLLTLQLYWLPLWGAEQRAMKQVYTNQLGWEKTEHHGRNGDGGHADTVVAGGGPTELTTEVLVGLVVLVVGLAVVLGLPVLSLWL